MTLLNAALEMPFTPLTIMGVEVAEMLELEDEPSKSQRQFSNFENWLHEI